LTVVALSNIMFDMKTLSVREVQHNLGDVLEDVRRGTVVTVTKRGRVIARIVPADDRRPRARWPDFEGRMKRLLPGGRPPPGAPASRLVREMRDDR
jgi:prevent-host-death family protein